MSTHRKKKNKKLDHRTGDVLVMIAGDVNVGKTSIHRRMQGEPPEQALLNYATKGLDYFQMAYRHAQLGEILVDIFDIDGKANFILSRDGWYNNIDAVILVYDVTKIDTFIHLERAWIPELLRGSRRPDLPILLIGNKMDLVIESPLVREVFERDILRLKSKFPIFNALELSAMDLTLATNPSPVDLFIVHVKHSYLLSPTGMLHLKQRKQETENAITFIDEEDEESSNDDDVIVTDAGICDRVWIGLCCCCSCFCF